MEKQTTRVSNPNLEPERSARPAWWNDTHTSRWDRVKEAIRRDWEQTKADFSKTSGAALNQNVGDTLKQAVGAAPLPPPSMKTHPDDPRDAAKRVEKELKERGRVQEKIAKQQERIADVRAEAGEKIAEVQQRFGEKVAEAQDWSRIEAAVRYGYGARLQYTDALDWNDALEAQLRLEWLQLKGAGAWDDMRAHVRRGWDSATRSSLV